MKTKKQKKLIVGMIVRNEAKRYLQTILKSIEDYASPLVELKIIILDDASTDNTPEVCESFPNTIVGKRTGKPLWSENEAKLRSQLWEMIRKEKSDWVLIQDADELFPSVFKARLSELLNTNWDWFNFRLCDMWDEEHYRIDGYWSPSFRRLFRFKDEPFGVTGHIHCPPIPQYAVSSNHGTCCMDIRVKHFSWVGEENRKEKMVRYSQIQMSGINAAHRDSVFKPARLKKWTEKIKLPKIKICVLFKDREWCMDRFFKSILAQNYPKRLLSLYFLENDSKDQTFERLKKWGRKWKKEYRKIEIIQMKFNIQAPEHSWPEIILKNMRYMRNTFLEHIEDNDYVFNLDSDVILQDSETLKHLALSDRDIICEVFWARWDRPNEILMPNVWPFGAYEGVSEAFLFSLKRKGIYMVGGLGACNLISKYAIEYGASFDEVSNLPSTMRGEDRYFCVRAVVLGFVLWADTYFPAKHLDKLDYDLRQKLEELRSKRKPSNRISLAMMVNDEAYLLDNFLYRMGSLFDEIVIVIDSRNKDNSAKIARKYTDRVYRFEWCDDYAKARNFLVSKTTCPWIFYADPDENYGIEKIDQFETMLTAEDAAGFIFLVFNYRGDRRQPSLSETLRLFRNLPELKFTGLVHETMDESMSKYLKAHPQLSVKLSPIPLYHWGFVKGPEHRAIKLAYYRKLNEKQLQANPKDCRPYYNLAMHLLEENGNQPEGLMLLQKAIELNPTFYQPRRELGLYHLREARKHFQQGVKVLPPTHPFYGFQQKGINLITSFLGEGRAPMQIQFEPQSAVPQRQ